MREDFKTTSLLVIRMRTKIKGRPFVAKQRSEEQTLSSHMTSSHHRFSPQEMQAGVVRSIIAPRGN